MKITKVKTLLGLLFISLCLSCTSQSSKNKAIKQDKTYTYASMKDGVLHLDLNEAQKHPREVKLSDIYSFRDKKGMYDWNNSQT